MKRLRNKKTGEIYDKINIHVSPWKIGTRGWTSLDYDSIDKFNEEWEDYKPSEPLIEDAGAREVLRLWAKVNLIPSNATTIEYHLAETLAGTETEFWDNNLHIMFYGNIAPNAVHGKIYTIDELCGEEE